VGLHKEGIDLGERAIAHHNLCLMDKGVISEAAELAHVALKLSIDADNFDAMCHVLVLVAALACACRLADGARFLSAH
jgi:hypothetical protein